MSILIREEDVERLSMLADGDAHGRAERLIAWVTDPRYAFEDGLTGEYPLTLAIEILLDCDDLDRAWQVTELLAQQSDVRSFEAAPLQMEILLRRGDRDAAEGLSDDVRRSRSADIDLCTRIGELFEEYDDPSRAERWFTIGVDVARREGSGDATLQMMLGGRYRIRREAGKPSDAMDEECDRLRAELGLDRLSLDHLALSMHDIVDAVREGRP